MLRIALMRAFAMVAFFAAAWLAPLRVYAALIPVCDGDAVSVSGWNPSAQGHGQTDAAMTDHCAMNAGSSDDVDPQVAAMCDDRGTSVVAPRRIDPLSDARIDAVDSCDGLAKGPFASISASDDGHGPDGLSWVNIDPATLVMPELVRPRIVSLVPEVFVETNGPRTGFDREIFHPPTNA